ncbi:MAG: ArnT family glycosyltransferase [Gemmataceae bacterium]
MQKLLRFRWMDIVWFVIIVALAGVVRYGYLHFVIDAPSTTEFAPNSTAPFLVQGTPNTIDPIHLDATVHTKVDVQEARLGTQITDLDLLVYHMNKSDRFASIPPLPRNAETGPIEETAHLAPGYPWFCALLLRFGINLILVQAVLGAITAGLYYAFARIAFRNMVVSVLAGLLCALHPFWIVNTGEIADGVLTSFLLGVCLVLGVAAQRSGHFLVGLLYGVALAGLSLVRAIMLPFSLVGLLWLLGRCRAERKTWLCPLLAVLGFVNGLALWSVRNYQVFDKEIVPISTGTYLHVWMGNNPNATGVSMSFAEIEQTLTTERVEVLQQMPQSKRFDELAHDAVEYVRTHPTETVKNRIRTTGYFFFGKAWFTGETDNPASDQNGTSTSQDDPEVNAVWSWVHGNSPLIVHSMLLGMLALGFLGWRWTHGPHTQTGLAALALVWIPLPYILSHAENYFGPRIPLDGILLTFGAFAIGCLIPGLRGKLFDNTAEVKKLDERLLGT